MVLLPSLCFLVFCLLAPDSYAKMGSGLEGILGNEDAETTISHWLVLLGNIWPSRSSY